MDRKEGIAGYIFAIFPVFVLPGSLTEVCGFYFLGSETFKFLYLTKILLLTGS